MNYLKQCEIDEIAKALCEAEGHSCECFDGRPGGWPNKCAQTAGGIVRRGIAKMRLCSRPSDMIDEA